MLETTNQDTSPSEADEAASDPVCWGWFDNPWTRWWAAWQKQLHRDQPVGQLFPLDPEEISQAFLPLTDELLKNPASIERANATLLCRLAEIEFWVMRRAAGEEAPEPVTPDEKDRRFHDTDWSHPLFSVIKQLYLVSAQWWLAAADAAWETDPEKLRRARFHIAQWFNALSPTNFPAMNPRVIKETLATGGSNLSRGFANFIRDLEQGEIAVARKHQFTVGKDLALSPGQVIYRNELVELLQYTPKTEQTYALPLLIIPPWINKYYILDITPDTSLVAYLVAQGFPVFLLSWRNPDAALSHLSMEDYLQLGALKALEVVQEISGAAKVNVAGYCIGGTLAAITLAYVAAAERDIVNSGTFLAALQDFNEVGETALFISKERLADIEARMQAKGYLSAQELSSIFRLMRSNDLIWHFFVNNYLLGNDPQPFDLMYWSVDGTRMPRAMHAYYLRNMYLENNLSSSGQLSMLGKQIDLGRIRCPSYVVAALDDHIVPWRSAHKAKALFSGPTRMILAKNGHITGIVNPPACGRGGYFSEGGAGEDADRWLAGASCHKGSWWPDWSEWLASRSGEKRTPPALGSGAYPPLRAAPGGYVLEE